MKKVLFILSAVGLLAGGLVAYVGARTPAALAPAFNPAANPYKDGIYASGILESNQASGQNINVYPEVSGTVKEILVKEGQDFVSSPRHLPAGIGPFVLSDQIARLRHAFHLHTNQWAIRKGASQGRKRQT